MMEKFQSVYRSHYSTEMALVRIFKDFTVNLDHGKGTCLALVDLSAAFDTIDHDKLLTYISDYLGFGDNTLKFMKSYLSDRTQCVQINVILSETTKLIIIIINNNNLDLYSAFSMLLNYSKHFDYSQKR